MSGHDQAVEATGWDYGAVAWFKSVFNKAAQSIQDQTVGRGKKAIESCGFELSDNQMESFACYALKVGQSMLVPVPSEEMQLNADLEAFSGTIAGASVEIGQIRLRGGEVWLYNFASWEGPTLQVASLKLGRVAVETDGYRVVAAIDLKKLKLQADGGNVLAVVSTCIAQTVKTTAARILPTADNRARTLKEQLTGVLGTRITSALTAGIHAEIGSLDMELEVELASDTGYTVGGGSVRVGEASLGLGLDKGKVALTGGLDVDLSGGTASKIDDLTANVDIIASGSIVADLGLIQFELIMALLDVSGTYAGQPTLLAATITAHDVGLMIGSDRQTFLACISRACDTAVSQTLGQLSAGRGAPQQIQQQLPATFIEKIKAILAASLTTELKAAVGSISADVTNATYGDMGVKGSVTARELELDVSVAPTTLPTVSMDGELDLDLSGHVATGTTTLPVEVFVNKAKASLDVRQGRFAVDRLQAVVFADGTNGVVPVPVSVRAILELQGMTLQTASTRDGLLECIGFGCATAVADAINDALTPSAGPGGIPQAQQVLAPNLMTRIKSTVATELTTRLKATITALSLDIRSARYGEWTGQGAVTMKNVTLDTDIVPDDAIDIECEGSIMVQALMKYAGEDFLDLRNMTVALDDKGSGKISGDFLLHSKRLKELIGSKVVKKLSQLFDKSCALTIPINQYLMDLAGIGVDLHSGVLTKLMRQFVLSNLRVTSQNMGVPTLKLSALKTSMVQTTGGDLGQLPASSGTDPILIAKQIFGGGGQGAVNLNAYVQNVLQAQLDSLRDALLTA